MLNNDKEQRELMKYIIEFVNFTTMQQFMKYKKLILLFNMHCGHCLSQFNTFKKPVSDHGMDMNIVEYKKYARFVNQFGNKKKAYIEYVKSTSIPISREGINNIEQIAIYIFPAGSNTRIGKKIEEEALSFSKIDVLYDTVRYPSWIDFKTHERLETGHHVEQQIRDLLDNEKLKSRRDRFKQYYSSIANRECDAVACGMKKQVKKIDPKDARLKKW